MQVLIAAIGTTGDVLPFIAAGAELRRRGHEVTLAAPAPFEAAARRSGLDFEAVISAHEYELVFSDPSLWRPLIGARRMFKALPLGLDRIYGFVEKRAEGRRPVLVASTLAIGARLAFEALGGHLVTVHLSPMAFQTRHDPVRMPGFPTPRWLPEKLVWKVQIGADRLVIDPVALPSLNAVRERLELKRVKRLRHWWNSPQKVVAMFPPWFQAAQADWPAQSVQFDFPAASEFGGETEGVDPALAAFLDAGDPPVVVTFGSTRRRTEALYAAAVQACADIGRRCLVLSRAPVVVPARAAASTFVAPYAPLGAVLGRAAALVHHGGVGTTAHAFAAGAPQIVAPLAFDQFDHAARVARLGCGLWLRSGPLERRRLAAALRVALSSPEIARRCAETAAACEGADAVARLCDEIEATAAGPARKPRPRLPPYPYGLAAQHVFGA
ncbi:glycosyltransferase [Methylopila turkensis]|uniref:Rhamnosyltransferase n=1 Tax=Methylopila turkensis TaxID=1437816 RepID=A0A9W6N897_9HYPH|nr:nucleotide disphospho-sugar-binding domain-containing protein [Methylopila turkensis]GLK81328.1 rhamnosyltransferase [Methylopila turkensis]